ncbi:AAA family ATPase [Rhizobium cauense]|uniref:AAA family ATPase n=1 Tax=Rhizobium cauense TaxID=1166683 RepID=UPI001C6E1C27|nr:AAA family ATPase [Rhizobium cauense]MBW9118224.1 AAA family ATPase [Rhizobium cauense]
MRINRLDLTRYGKFTDATIDFGSRPIGSPDLHIVYGPNEAGKSTTLDAILDLIFGIGNATKYGFLHPYPTMRLGANIHVGGRDREFARIKKQQNSLLDHEEKTLADAEIRADLGGIDRDAFATMFSLDESTLVKGGESILASKGNLGELLFSASAGLSDLSKQLLEIRGDADSFYKYRSRSGTLGELKAKLADLKSEKDALDLQASDYQRLVGERDRLRNAYQEVVAERAGIQRRVDEISRTLRTLPSMTRLAAFKERLAALADAPDPPASWQQELPDLRRLDIEYRVKEQDVLRSLAMAEKELGEITPDLVALGLASRMDELAERKARYLTAEKDIPKLSARAAELAIESLLLQLGRPSEPSPARLVLDAATVGTLRELISSKSGIDMRRSAAANELAKLERALSPDGSGVPKPPDALSPQQVKAFEVLSATLRAIPRSDEELALRSIMRRRDATSAALSEALAKLGPWRAETLAVLAEMAVPSAIRLETWKNEFKDANELARTAGIDLDRLQPELRRLEAEMAAVRVGAGEIDEAGAAASLASRERAWILHRQAFDDKSADAFEAAMRANDHVVAQRLLHFAEVGKLNQLLQRHASVAADIETATNARDGAHSALERVRSEIAGYLDTAAPHCGLDTHPLELEEWLRKRNVALAVRDDLNEIEHEIANVNDRAAKARELLTKTLANAGVGFDADADIAALVAVAEGGLHDFHTRMDHWEKFEQLRKQYNERAQALDEAIHLSEDWDLKWAATCKGCWLGESNTVPDIGAVGEILATLGKLASAIENKESLIDRVQKMEKDVAQFQAIVAEIAERLGLPVAGSPEEVAQSIADAVRIALFNQDRREKLDRDLEEIHRTQRGLAVSREIVDARIQKMLDFFDALSLEEVEARIELSTRRRELKASIDELQQELIEVCGARDFTEVEERASQADKETLEAELAELSPVLEGHERRWNDLFHELSKAQEALESVGGDARVAAIEERRRTTLLEIEERARHYMELRAGIAAAEHGLRLYRDRHRSGMMTRASEAFRLISRGSYQGVAAQPGKDGEVLIARSASEGSKVADELSKGARFQLYLALRIAGYHEFVANRPSIPFIADDIMESFDDFRAEEAFRLFAEMAKHGQVVYLTHHRHLVEIARKVCPAVHLHDLGDVAPKKKFDIIAAE